jgi:HAMP domain-containing protein
MTTEQISKIKEAEGVLWKKVLWWSVGFIGLLGTVFLIACLLKKKGPLTSALEIVQDTKDQINLLDVQAKIEAARAASVEKAVVDKLQDLLQIPDEKERNKQLAKLLAEDY